MVHFTDILGIPSLICIQGKVYQVLLYNEVTTLCLQAFC